MILQLPKCHVMQIPVDIYFKIKRLKSSRSTGCKFVWYSDRNGRGCGRIETSSCIWSNVWWNTTLDRAGILQKWNEFLCSSNRKTNDKHYKTLRHISFFFFFYDFIVYILWINKNLDESVNIQKFTKPPFFLFIFDFLFLLYFSISVFTKLICLLALEVC